MMSTRAWVFTLCITSSGLVWAAGAKAHAKTTSNTATKTAAKPDVKGAVQDAMAPPAKETTPAAPAAASENALPELDVSKMVFSPDSVKKVVGHHQSQIQACYEEMLAGQKKA